MINGCAEASALRQFVLGAAADEAGGVGPAQQPGDGGGRFAGRQLGEVEQVVGGGVAAAGDGDAPAGEARPVSAEDVGDAVGDAVGGVGFTAGGDAGGAERVGCCPGAGGVDDGGGRDLAFVTVLDVADDERRLDAVGAVEAAAAPTGDCGDGGAELEVRVDGRVSGERFEVALDDLGTGGVISRVRMRPAPLVQEGGGVRVDVERPG